VQNLVSGLSVLKLVELLLDAGHLLRCILGRLSGGASDVLEGLTLRSRVPESHDEVVDTRRALIPTLKLLVAVLDAHGKVACRILRVRRDVVQGLSHLAVLLVLVARTDCNFEDGREEFNACAESGGLGQLRAGEFHRRQLGFDNWPDDGPRKA
jgi:hypothetical protein